MYYSNIIIRFIDTPKIENTGHQMINYVKKQNITLYSPLDFMEH